MLLRGVQIEDASFPGRSSDAATCNSYTCKTSRDESEGLLKFASESCPPSRQLGGIYKWLKQMKSNFLAFPWDSMSRMVLETWFLFTRLGQLGTPVFFPTSVFLSVSCEESENSPNSSSVNKMTVSVLGGMLLQL